MNNPYHASPVAVIAYFLVKTLVFSKWGGGKFVG